MNRAERAPPASGCLVDEDLRAWCRRWLAAEPVQVLFETGNLSRVLGLRLSDEREVVVKLRPPARRLRACAHIQQHLWSAGFPCPRPIAGPAAFGPLAATAEAFVPGGVQYKPGPDRPRAFAEALATLVALAPPAAALPTLGPPPAWVRWCHAEPGPWPRPARENLDLNQQPAPAWLAELAHRARRKLLACRQPPVIGHADWESQNVRWVGERLHAVDDWDSLAALPEAAIAGAASAVFTTPGRTAAATTLAEAEAFLHAYEQYRRRPWSTEDRQVCWAAGLWVLAFNARLESLRVGSGLALSHLASHGEARLRLAGA